VNFRECVIDCIAEGEVVRSFNRLYDASITADLLERLMITDDGQLRLVELDDEQQQLLACFILFVHRHVWRKLKFAESRVTRIHDDQTRVLDLSGLERVRSSGNGLHS
jgi:hypothetical protein